MVIIMKTKKKPICPTYSLMSQRKHPPSCSPKQCVNLFMHRVCIYITKKCYASCMRPKSQKLPLSARNKKPGASGWEKEKTRVTEGRQGVGPLRRKEAKWVTRNIIDAGLYIYSPSLLHPLISALLLSLLLAPRGSWLLAILPRPAILQASPLGQEVPTLCHLQLKPLQSPHCSQEKHLIPASGLH